MATQANAIGACIGVVLVAAIVVAGRADFIAARARLDTSRAPAVVAAQFVSAAARVVGGIANIARATQTDRAVAGVAGTFNIFLARGARRDVIDDATEGGGAAGIATVIAVRIADFAGADNALFVFPAVAISQTWAAAEVLWVANWPVAVSIAAGVADRIAVLAATHVSFSDAANGFLNAIRIGPAIGVCGTGLALPLEAKRLDA